MRLEQRTAVRHSLQISVICMVWAISAAILDLFSRTSNSLSLVIGGAVVLILLLSTRYAPAINWIAWSTPVIGLLAIFFGFGMREWSDNSTAAFFLALLIVAIGSSIMALRGKT
jgi:hypothetical protein